MGGMMRMTMTMIMTTIELDPPHSQRQSILYYCDYDDGCPSIVDDYVYNEDDEENEDDDGDLNWSHPPHTRRSHTAAHHSVPL